MYNLFRLQSRTNLKIAPLIMQNKKHRILTITKPLQDLKENTEQKLQM